MLIRLLMAIFLLGITSAHAWQEERTVEQAVTVDSVGQYPTIAVGTTTTATTKSIALNNLTVAGAVGIMYKATSSGVIGISVQAFRSFQKAATEGGADPTYIQWNLPSTTGDSAWHLVTLDTVVTNYMRLAVTGTGSNDASTTVQIKVLKQ